ncbi:MAG: F0F1 ATP synthase subunit A [Proteobacteria bacterium]|nr:F0F1 ATP synthase subunit A [Pseudomonadota bacterium]
MTYEPSILGWMADHLGTPRSWDGPYRHVVTAAFVALTLIGAGLIVRKKLKDVPARLIPDGRVTLSNLFELISEALLRLMEDLMGPGAKKHLPFVGALFIYLLVSDLIGVIPGFFPPTENINTNLGCAVVVFIYYNYTGIREQGLKGYLRHMAGPVIWLAPLLFMVEVVSHVVRPVSLSIRLMGNVAGDHLVVGIFSELMPFLVPIAFIALSIFISTMQAFVFTLLSIVYIHLASGDEA